MKAVILAAGKSSRLYPMTLTKPKCLLNIGQQTILDRQINSLKNNGIDDIIVVVGYKKDEIIKQLDPDITYREYMNYENTNNLHTLWSIRNDLDDDFICLFSDVLFDDEILVEAIKSTKNFCMIIDTNQVLEGTMRVSIKNDRLTGIGSQISVQAGNGNFIGIAKYTKSGTATLLKQMKGMVGSHTEDYYTLAINDLAKGSEDIGYIKTKNYKWIEIDTMEDYEKAKELFS